MFLHANQANGAEACLNTPLRHQPATVEKCSEGATVRRLRSILRLSLSQSNNDLTPKARISSGISGSNHDNEGSLVVVDIILPTALLVIGVVAVGGCLVYIFARERRH